jgi:hypothetical protein
LQFVKFLLLQPVHGLPFSPTSQRTFRR